MFNFSPDLLDIFMECMLQETTHPLSPPSTTAQDVASCQKHSAFLLCLLSTLLPTQRLWGLLGLLVFLLKCFYRLSREKVSTTWTICHRIHRVESMTKALEIIKSSRLLHVSMLALYYKWKLFVKAKGVVMIEHQCCLSLFLVRKW